MSLAPILYIGFSRLDVVPDPAERVGSDWELVGMALITMCLGVTAASFYEIYEWVVDHWVATDRIEPSCRVSWRRLHGSCGGGGGTEAFACRACRHPSLPFERGFTLPAIRIRPGV
jgi:hypothetical protein